MRKPINENTPYGVERKHFVPDSEINLNGIATAIRDELADYDGISLYVDTTSPKSIDKSIVLDLTDYEVNGQTLYMFIDCDENSNYQNNVYEYRVISVDNKNKKAELASEENLIWTELIDDIQLVVKSLSDAKRESDDREEQAETESLNEGHELGKKFKRLQRVLRG